ncbi:acetoacetate--CoA ligase [soil metagenome]
MSGVVPDGEVLWHPVDGGVTAVAYFMEHVRTERRMELPDYRALWTWSTTEPEEFWASVWTYFGLDALSAYEGVLSSREMPGANWFAGATLNFATYALSAGDPEDIAIIGADESGAVVRVTRRQLRADVAHLAATLHGLGVAPGDVVVGYLPNITEAMTTFLAVASLGATFSSVGQDYSAPAVVDRFAQLAPVVLVAADGYRYGGKQHDRRAHVDEVRATLGSIRATILIDHIGAGTLGADGAIDWCDAIAPRPVVEAATVPFDHPLWVLFSSGTTGLPKGLIHGHGGILLESLKQMRLHWDVGPGDVVFWYTSPSWVMWNLLMSNLVTGATVVCYDGSPTHPDPSAMWRVVEDLKVTFFGTSPGYLQASERHGVHPRVDHDLSALRAMGSTGSPLPPDVHRWARDEVGPIPLWSMSGGTDVAGAFAGGSPLVPVWAGELSAPCLGVAIEAWGDDGRQVRQGSVGELVITMPMPSMPIALWNDTDGSRYRDTYFTYFDGVWRQGDWITVTERGSLIIHGRSDSTLNRNGVRMGSADIYAAVDEVSAVVESLVLGVEQSDGGYWMPLFVVLEPNVALDDQLVETIRTAIRTHASPRHIPDDIIQVRGIPHTRTGKKLEVPLKRILQGTLPEGTLNPDAVDDPSLVQAFVEIAAIRLNQ